MSSSYPGNPANVVPAAAFTITIPSDGDAASAASVNSPGPFEPVADKLAYLDQLIALNAALNVQPFAVPVEYVSMCATGFSGAGVQLVAVGDSSTGDVYTSTGPANAAFTWSSWPSGLGLVILHDVASSGSLLVAVGVGPSIITSTNGTAWTTRANTAVGDPLSVCWSSALSLWCAVGQSGAVVTSPDGITWTNRSAGGVLNFTNVAFGAGLFVAIAGGSTSYYTSPDGVTWTNHTLPAALAVTGPVTPKSLIFANGLFVYPAASGVLYTSPNGTTWTSRGAPAGTSPLCAIAWSGKLFRASAGSNLFATSFDGITWTRRYSTALVNSSDTVAIAASDGRILVGNQSAATNYVSQTWQTP